MNHLCKWLISLLLLINSVACFAAQSPENLSENALIIHQTLQELNSTIFSPDLFALCC